MQGKELLQLSTFLSATDISSFFLQPRSKIALFLGFFSDPCPAFSLSVGFGSSFFLECWIRINFFSTVYGCGRFYPGVATLQPQHCTLGFSLGGAFFSVFLAFLRCLSSALAQPSRPRSEVVAQGEISVIFSFSFLDFTFYPK